MPDPTDPFRSPLPLTPEGRSGLIFAGGRATRLGGLNKALLDIGGRPIIARILDALAPLVSDPVVLANADAAPTFEQLHDLRVVLDPDPHAGVLPALAAGLEAASGEVCLAVACDMPFVSTALFHSMLNVLWQADADVVICRTGGFLEPMHAVYRREPVLRAIRMALGRGEQRMISYFSDVRVRELDQAEWRQADPSGVAFFNVNTPEDLATARRMVDAESGGDFL